MRIAVLTVKLPFIHGGAEIHAEGLVSALTRSGFEVDLFAIPFKAYPPEKLLDHMLACRLFDFSESEGRPIDLLIGLKFPAYMVPHSNKVIWLMHQHRQAYDLWDDPQGGDLIHHPHGLRIREAVTRSDKQFIGEAQAIFANSLNVANRLRRYCGISSTVLYHPPKHADLFFCDSPSRYLFFPSRILSTKRQELVLEALGLCRNPVKAKFAGAPNNAEYFRHLRSKYSRLESTGRVEWMGAVTEESKREAYANCLAVIYPPLDEDYGYVTLEAMLSSKPVITCTDSGGPLEFIENRVDGLVAEGTPPALADAMDDLWSDPARATRYGSAGRDKYRSMRISWDHVVEVLVSKSQTEAKSDAHFGSRV